MVYKFCNVESAIATCDSYNYPPKLLRKPNSHNHQQPILRRFMYTDLETATNGFSPSNLLGKGSHGAVYKAILDGGKLIAAVKRPSSAAVPAAENEVDILPRIANRRIVNLIGYAAPDPNNKHKHKHKLLLVVEYMPNGSLYDLIHRNPTPPSWRARVRVALQVAEAVRTIHLSDPPVIHRDIKSSNILLDRKCNARLSDFGLALRGHAEDVRVMSTPPAGTLGYLDPCYITPDDVSSKCDVFSFGILLLEIISGRRAIDFEYSPPCVVEWAIPLIKSGDYLGVCDRRMRRNEVDLTVLKELALLAVRCVRSTAEKRPPVTQVVEVIKMVYNRMKLMKGVPTWQGIGRRVRRVERSQPLIEIDGGDEQVKTTKHHRIIITSTKVSNVSSNEDQVGEMATRGEHRTGRVKMKLKSKSVGSYREIKVGPEVDDYEISGNGIVKERGKEEQVMRVKLLSKSRSMSVLQCGKNGSYQSYFGNSVNHGEVKELDVVPLLVNLRTKSSTP